MREHFRFIVTGAAGSLASQLLGLVANKILAVTLGISGLGLLGLARQVQEAVISWGGIGTGGLVQGLAGREGSAREQLAVAAVTLSLAGTASAVVFLLVFPDLAARLMFADSAAKVRPLIAVIAFIAVVGVVVSLLQSVVNAARAIGFLVLASVSAGAAAAVFAWPLGMAAHRTPIALAAILAVPLLAQFAILAYALRRIGWWPGRNVLIRTRPQTGDYLYLFRFLAYNVAIFAVATGGALLLRAVIVRAGGLPMVGLFTAAWTLSLHGMALLLSSFGTYLVPTLAASPDKARASLQDAMTLLLAGSIPFAVAAIVLKSLVLRLLYSPEFVPAVTLLQWLLIGNYIRGLNWVFGAPFVAFGDVRRMLTFEAGWNILFFGAAVVLLRSGQGIAGVGVAYVAACSVTLVYSAWTCRARFDFWPDVRSSLCSAAGLVLCAVAAAATWNGATLDLFVAVPCIVLAGGLAVLVLSPHRRRRAWQLLADKGLGWLSKKSR